MEKALLDFLDWYGRELRIEYILNENDFYLMVGISLLAFLSCFFGLKIYRYVVAGLMFFLLSALLVVLFQNSMNWGAVTTMFTLLGIILAFAAFTWEVAGASILFGLIVGSAVYAVSHSFIVFAIAGILVSTIAYYYPVWCMVIGTTVWGSAVSVTCLGYFTGTRWNPAILMLIFGGLGFGVQFITNYRQIPLPHKLRKKEAG